MTERRRMFVLNNPTAPRLSPELANEIGLNESIILLQIEFWISISDHNIDDKWWTYQSIREIKKTFMFWSLETINRAIKSLMRQELIEVANYNKAKYDKTRWFAICEKGLKTLQSITVLDDLSQNETPLSNDETSESQNETQPSQDVTTIPETTTEIIPKNTTKTTEKGKPSPTNGTEVQEIFKAIQAFYGYPDKTDVDPIPNYGKEGKAIKRLLARGFNNIQILDCWMAKCRQRDQFVSMQWVNEDIKLEPKKRKYDDNNRQSLLGQCHRKYKKITGEDPTPDSIAEYVDNAIARGIGYRDIIDGYDPSKYGHMVRR